MDHLTTPDDQLQTWCVAALRPLMSGNAQATERFLEANGVFVLSSLLGSPSGDIQGHALAALGTILATVPTCPLCLWCLPLVFGAGGVMDAT